MVVAAFPGEHFHAWQYGDDRSRSWNWRLRFWRVQLCLRTHRHRSANPQLGTRWVIQPELTFDRRP
jgi:hypothetical protein